MQPLEFPNCPKKKVNRDFNLSKLTFEKESKRAKIIQQNVS